MKGRKQYQNTPLSQELFGKLVKLTYENKFGTNCSAYIRSLIEHAWLEHQQVKANQAERHGLESNSVDLPGFNGACLPDRSNHFMEKRF